MGEIQSLMNLSAAPQHLMINVSGIANDMMPILNDERSDPPVVNLLFQTSCGLMGSDLKLIVTLW